MITCYQLHIGHRFQLHRATYKIRIPQLYTEKLLSGHKDLDPLFGHTHKKEKVEKIIIK